MVKSVAMIRSVALKSRALCVVTAALAGFLLVPRVAHAQSCTDALNPCFAYTNFSSGAIGGAIYGSSGGGGYGVKGTNTSGVGVRANAISGYGLYATSTDTTYGVPIYAVSSSANASVWGATTKTDGIGVRGDGDADSTGVYGYNPTGNAAFFDGDVYYTGTLSHWSDGRLKKDVQDLNYGLKDLMKLRPVTFAWKTDELGKRHVGFIAQEVEKVIPEAVSVALSPGSSDALAITDSELLPLLVKAVQDQHKTILQQESRIAELERKSSPFAGFSIFGTAGALSLLPLGLGLVLVARRRQQRA